MTLWRHAEIGLANSLVIVTFFDAHPAIVKILSVMGLAVLSTITAELTKRVFPRRNPRSP